MLGGGHIGVVPVSVIVMLVIVAAGWVFATRTVLGKNVYAVGNSEKAAKLSGIRVETTKTVVFTITGLLTGVCGLILMGQLEGADAFYGNGYELDVIAAAVIGGISLAGRRGKPARDHGRRRADGRARRTPSCCWPSPATGRRWRWALVIIGAVSIDSLRKRR